VRLVLVEWVDSFGCSSEWVKLEGNLDHQPIVCRSVGWLYYDGEDCKVIIPHLADVPGDLQQGCGDMTIPTPSIRRLCDLKEAADDDAS